MTSEVAQYEAPAQQIAPAMMTVAENLQAHVAALNAADTLAAQLHKFVKAYDGGTENGKKRAGQPEAAIAIYHGQQIGFGPLESLQNIFVVHGTPGMYARAMKALLISKGHTIRTVESSPTQCIVEGVNRRLDANDPDNWEQSTWTIERAKKAGYTSNRKYETEPENMLYAKALTECCRRVAPEALMGLAGEDALEIIEGEVVSSEQTPQPKGLRARVTRHSDPVADMSQAKVVDEKPAAKKSAPKSRASSGSNQSAKQDTPQAEPLSFQIPDDAATLEQLKELGRLLDIETLTTPEAKLGWINDTYSAEYVDPRQMTTKQASEAINYLAGEQAKDPQ